MEFFAVNGKRPLRSSEETRKFAFESLNYKYGLEAKENPCVNMDDICGFENLSDIEKHDLIIERIAKTAPIRICENEKISGAATLGDAISHIIPARFNGKYIFSSVSHLTVDFETVLTKGIDFIEENAKKHLKIHKNTEREAFINSCLNCISYIKIWHQRYIDALKDKPEYINNFENLKNVPFKPAKNFYEAVQSLWFTFAFLRLCGNWSGIGRIDFLLGNYLEKDLKNGTITLEEAREILAHFFIKGCEWICGGNHGSGDAQHYQNIVLGGVDRDGNEITNTVTYLVLDILEEFGISDFPTTVRIGKNTPEKLINRVAEVIRFGGGVVAVYNEDLIINALTNYGYTLPEARSFANDGCWEVQVPGKTCFGYNPFDALRILQVTVLENYNEELDFDTFEDLYNKYSKHLKSAARWVANIKTRECCFEKENESDPWIWKPTTPCTVVSIFEQGCIENGRSYYEGGPIYNVSSPHIGGLPDAVNCLYAIKKLVYDDKLITFKELIKTLKANWQDNEYLRQFALNKYSYFGNDNDEVDNILKDLLNTFADGCDEARKTCAFLTPAGVSTFGRQLEWSSHRLATPFGKFAHDVLAANLSPTPSTDKNGITAIIKSYCKCDLNRIVNGAALDIKILPTAVKGEKGLESIAAILKSFVTLGGFFMQLDIADAELLKDAQIHPENHRNLSVRVSGWNARFVTLNKEWQDMIIAQTGGDF